jgi:hypothetical protein
MVKINNTAIFTVNSTPADDDLLLGTDVSNTSNDPDGETVNFRVDAITGGPKLLATVDAVVGDTEIIMPPSAFDNSKFDLYLLTLENVEFTGTASNTQVFIRFSNNGGTTYLTSGYQTSSTSGVTPTNAAYAETGAFDTSQILNGSLWFGNNIDANTKPYFNGSFAEQRGTSYAVSQIVGTMTSNMQINSVEISISAVKTLASGKIRLYGVRG